MRVRVLVLVRVCSASCKHNTDARTGIRITVLPAVSQVAVAQSSGTPNASSEHSAICSPSSSHVPPSHTHDSLRPYPRTCHLPLVALIRHPHKTVA